MASKNFLKHYVLKKKNNNNNIYIMYIIVKFYFTLFYMIFYVKICLHLGVEKILIFNSL